jgi:hypothetical protein
MTSRVILLVVVWVAVVAGCTTPSDPPPSPPTSTAQQQGPRDRDEDEVLAALRRIDLCEVLAAAPGLPAEPRAPQPFRCVAGDIAVTVVGFAHEARLALPSQAVGNAKAYVQADGCRVVLPVSFELASSSRSRPDHARASSSWPPPR